MDVFDLFTEIYDREKHEQMLDTYKVVLHMPYMYMDICMVHDMKTKLVVLRSQDTCMGIDTVIDKTQQQVDEQV